jgi:D-threo-aldose 1-dehydrogenase
VRVNRLGRTDVEVTTLGFGGGPIGGLYRAIDDETAVGALQAAWDGGVRYFDTAPHYGIGHSERRFGLALRERDRTEFTLSTKVGRLLVEQDANGTMDDSGFHVLATHRRVWDFSRDGVRRSVEESLQRLQMNRVDIVLLHDAQRHWEDALRTGVPALVELRDEGTIGAVGAGMGSDRHLVDLVHEADVDVVMVAGRYTLLEQGALDELLPACAQRGVSALVAAPFNSGVLATGWPPDDAMYEYSAAPATVLRRARQLAVVCKSFGVTLPQAALQFPLGHQAVASVVAGMESAEQVHDNLAAFEAPVPAELWVALRDEGLIDERAALPA